MNSFLLAIAGYDYFQLGEAGMTIQEYGRFLMNLSTEQLAEIRKEADDHYPMRIVASA